jgi:uncharacterized membrane protein YhaH (DUF805 family)
MKHSTRAEHSPGLVIVGVAAVAFVICVTNFALGEAGAGVAAAIVGLLTFGAGLAWLAMDGRRIRDAARRGRSRRPSITAGTPGC